MLHLIGRNGSSIMADHLAVEAEDDEIFVYMGGDQRVPDGVRRARIHRDVKIIPARAFHERTNLIDVEFHNEIRIIEDEAFRFCPSLRSLKILGIKIIKERAFTNCSGLTDVEFGDKLETIEYEAFYWCTSLMTITMPFVRTIGDWAFYNCCQLTDLELPEELETIEGSAFTDCRRLRHIAMPLRDDMIGMNVFDGCTNLTTVDLVWGTNNTAASLHMESWRKEMRMTKSTASTMFFPTLFLTIRLKKYGNG